MSLRHAFLTLISLWALGAFLFLGSGCEHRPPPGPAPSTAKIEYLDLEELPAEYIEVIKGAELEAVLRAAWFKPIHQVTIQFGWCGGEVNGWYSPSKKRIRICYETILVPWVVFEDPAAGHAFGRFVLAHELGHALIDLGPLPAVGPEEWAADQFASVLLAEGMGRPDDVLWAARWWGLRSAMEEDPTDPHPGSARRQQDILAYWAGSTGRLQDAITEGLDWLRALYSASEWKDVVWAWKELLGRL